MCIYMKNPYKYIRRELSGRDTLIKLRRMTRLLDGDECVRWPDCDGSLSGVHPHFPQQANPISRKNAADVFFGVTALLEDAVQFLQIGDGIEVARRLFGAKAAIEVGADAAVPRRAQ